MKTYIFRNVILSLALTWFLAPNANAGELTLTPSSSAAVKKSDLGASSGFLLQFDMPRTLTGAEVYLAELRFRLNVDTTKTGELGSINLIVSPASDDWRALGSTITTPSLAHKDSLQVVQRIKIESNETYEINVTEIVKLWAGSKIANQGFYVFLDSENERGLAVQGGASIGASLRIRHSN